MSLLLMVAILFGSLGLLLTPSSDPDTSRIGIVMLVSGFVFAAITYLVSVGP